jgi:hypothetical protein
MEDLKTDLKMKSGMAKDFDGINQSEGEEMLINNVLRFIRAGGM